MPYIRINENDNTVYGKTYGYTDDIVFVPGAAITGPREEATLISSVSQFISVFGPYYPTRGNNTIGSSWDYAYNLLLQGMPILYYRITDNVQSEERTESITYASADLLTNYSDSGKEVVGKVKDIYGGSFGNTLNVTFEKTNTAYYIRVYRNEVFLESALILTKKVEESDDDVRQRLIEAIPRLELNYVKIEVTDEENFVLTPVEHLQLSGGKDISEDIVKTNIARTYETISDKYVYDVKFLTSGGYTDDSSGSLTISNAMLTLAQERLDCLAVLDIPIGTPMEDVQQFFSSINSSYATAFAPWIYFRLKTGESKWMPPSFVFLYELAKSVSIGNPIYLPPAGVKRALVSETIRPEYEIGSSILEEWQNNEGQHINPIMRIKQYGYAIYGQKTLYYSQEGATVTTSALQELAVRITANEIKREIYNISLSLTFDQNDIRTWNEFRGQLDPYLSLIKSNRGISDYQIIMDESLMSDDDFNNNLIKGVVRISVMRAAENFDITFDLEPQSVVFDKDEDQFAYSTSYTYSDVYGTV